jgi:hypothetical protein
MLCGCEVSARDLVWRTDKRDADPTELNMTDIMGSGEAEEGTGAKQTFIGRVKFSRVDCDCEICQKGREAAEQGGYDIDPDFDHIFAIEPLTEYENQQNVLGLNASKSYGSKWMMMTGHIENLLGTFAENGIETMEDLADFLEDRVLEFRDLTFEEDEEFTWEHAAGGDGYTANINNLFRDMENPPDSMLVPVGEITDEEKLAELGAEESIETEEVEF